MINAVKSLEQSKCALQKSMAPKDVPKYLLDSQIWLASKLIENSDHSVDKKTMRRWVRSGKRRISILVKRAERREMLRMKRENRLRGKFKAIARAREEETPEQTEARLRAAKEASSRARELGTSEQTEARLRTAKEVSSH